MIERKFDLCHNEGCSRPSREPKISNEGYEIHYKDCHVCANLKSNYGITGPQRDKLCEEQSWKCAICNDEIHLPPPSNSKDRHPKNAVVDHDHNKPKEKAIRGILCSQCNRGLGVLCDNNIESALKYLNKYKELYV